MTGRAAGTWTGSHTRYLVKETAFGLVITIVLSCAFALAVFGRSLPVNAANPLLQIDAGLQAFIVAFMGSLVPAAVTRRRVRAKTITPLPRPHRWPANLIVRSGAIAGLVAVPAAVVHAVIMTAQPELNLSLAGLLIYKAGFGLVVALLATPLAVLLALRGE